MDLGFSLIIMLKKSVFVEAIEAVWIQYRIDSHQFQTNQQSSDLAIVLHINLKKI